LRREGKSSSEQERGSDRTEEEELTEDRIKKEGASGIESFHLFIGR